jgi:tetratricopeptide (TPR) repeat protein
MGIVYRAFDRTHNEIVALKTIKGLDASAIAHLKQEFRTLADISHPNLVTLHELVSNGEEWFFTMELVDGSDFLTHINSTRDRFQCLRETLPQLLEGVSALHRAGILHRDIKPSNVRVTKEGKVVLLDFGLAAHMEESGQYQTIDQHVVGTFAYMAPEQAGGSPISPASDWYSVGVMIYQALTGKLPFNGNSYRVLLEKQQKEARPPFELTPGLPEDLNALCVGLLRREPKDRLTEEQVRELLKTPAPVADRSLTGREPLSLLGREEQLAALREAYQNMRTGQTVVFYLHGRSGMGKTALMQRFLHDLAQTRQAVILAGRCYEHEAVPYKALDSLIDALSRYLRQLSFEPVQALLPRDVHSLVRVFPALGQVKAIAEAPHPALDIPDQQELRRHAVAALRELLSRIADRRPVVLAIDDLQWGDVDSGALLLDLLRPPDSPTLLLIGLYRSEDVDTSPCLKLLRNDGRKQAWIRDQREASVESLSATDSRKLALKTLGHINSATTVLADRISQEAGGDPLFVQELVRHIQGKAVQSGTDSSTAALSLESVLWERIRQLPESAYKLLEVIAVAGRPLNQLVACRAAELGPDSWGPLTLLRSERLIRGTGMVPSERLETYHDRIRETVVANLAPHAAGACHRRLAEALEFAAGTDPEELAVHYDAAGETEKAARYYAEAATHAAQALAFDRATTLYRSALQLLGENDSQCRDIRIGLANALANAGRGAEAAVEYLNVARISNPAESLEFQRLSATHLMIAGHIDEGLEQLESVLRKLGMRLHKASWRVLCSYLLQQAWLKIRGLQFRERDVTAVPPELLQKIDTCWSAVTGLSIVDPIHSAAFASRGLLLSLQAGEPNRLARFLAACAAQVAVSGPRSHDRAQQLLQRAETISGGISDPHAKATVEMCRGAADWLSGNWLRAGKYCEGALEILRTSCTGVWWELNTAQTIMLDIAHFTAGIEDYTRYRSSAMQEARNRGDLFALTIAGSMILPVLANDEPDQAEREVNILMEAWSRKGFHVQHFYARYARIITAMYRGDISAAWHLANNNWGPMAKAFLFRVQMLRILTNEVRARCALSAAAVMSDAKPYIRISELNARRLAREGVTWAKAHAHLISAGVAAFRQDQRGGEMHLNAAIDAFTEADMPIFAAACRWRLGELIGDSQGIAAVDETKSWMLKQGIRNPERMMALLAPMPGQSICYGAKQ